jgi:sugar lactone lactonase YvrE
LVIEALEDRLCLSIDLLVTSYYFGDVHRYNGTTGAFLGTFVSQGYGDLSGALAANIGSDGNLLVSSAGTDSVKRYDAFTGAYLGDFVTPHSGGLTNPHGVIFGPDGNLYVSSANTNSVLRYSGTTGHFIDAFVYPNSGGVSNPNGLTFGPDGNLYVNSNNNSAVMRYDGTTGDPLPADGQSGAVFVSSHSGGLDRPIMGIAFGPDGNLYVGGNSSNNVLRYDGQTGTFIDEFVHAGSGGLISTHGIAFGPDGNLYVCSQFSDEVLRYDGNTGVFLDAFTGNSPLREPSNVFFWDTGDNSPIGHGGGTSHHVAASAVHASGLADAAVLVGLVGVSGQPHGGDVLGSAAVSSDSRPANAVTPAPAVWTTTADSVTAAIPGMPVSRSVTHAAADTLFEAWATEISSLEPLAWLDGL